MESLQAGPEANREEAGFGASPMLPRTGFIVLGLLTFWVYTAIRLGAAVRDHFATRWQEIGPRLQAAGMAADRLEAIARHAYPTSVAVPLAAAALFGTGGVVAIWWFWQWILVGDTSYYARIMSVVGVSSFLFYGGTCLLAGWTARRLYHHETVEFLLQAQGPAAAQGRLAPTAEMVARWERHNDKVVLFLVVALPIVASPAVSAHLFLTGAGAAYEQWLAPLCFALAAVFHYWGTKLLVGLFNTHLATEAAQAGVAGTAAAARRPAPQASEPIGDIGTLGPYDGVEPFIFVSYKRDDFDRIRPVLERVRESGYRVWYDKGIPGGAEWDALIEQKAKTCSMLLFFLSAGSVESRYCRREVKYADQLGKPILSVKLEPVELAHGLEMLLTQYQMVDAASPDVAGEIGRSLKYLRLL